MTIHNLSFTTCSNAPARLHMSLRTATNIPALLVLGLLACKPEPAIQGPEPVAPETTREDPGTTTGPVEPQPEPGPQNITDPAPSEPTPEVKVPTDPAPDSAPPLPTLGATTTPAMRQYLEAKRQYPLALMLFRMGDFYELFYEDALVAARALDLTLTSRSIARRPACPRSTRSRS